VVPEGGAALATPISRFERLINESPRLCRGMVTVGGAPFRFDPELWQEVGNLARQKESAIEEGHWLPDHVPMLIAIPPKYAVSEVIGFIKGKSAIHMARVYGERRRNFTGQHFWARGYFVSTVGRDETVIRGYIRRQEEEDRRLDQLHFDPDEPPSGGAR